VTSRTARQPVTCYFRFRHVSISPLEKLQMDSQVNRPGATPEVRRERENRMKHGIRNNPQELE
jgi:hypothetical protein